MNMAPNNLFYKFNNILCFILSIFILFIFNGCNFRDISSESTELNYIVSDYLSRLKNKDNSLLEDLNFVTSENIEITGWKEEYEGKRGFYIQLMNKSDRVIFIHPLEYNILSSVFNRDDGNWVDVNFVVRPSKVIPYIILPNKVLNLRFAIKDNLPDDLNMQVVFSIPKYSEIADRGELKYSEYRLIKRFEITKERNNNNRGQ